MSAERNSERIVIAGASSLLGGELKSLLEESRFAGWDLRLVDEELAVGTLTEAGGEAAVIQRVEEDTFRGARIAFLAGSSEFGRLCLGPARQAGATIIDYTHASLSDPDATPWFPKIEHLTGRSVAKDARTFSVFSPGGMAVTSLALALRRHGLQRLVATLYWPVSEAGREGIEELETQTSQLLTFQSVGHAGFRHTGGIQFVAALWRREPAGPARPPAGDSRGGIGGDGRRGGGREDFAERDPLAGVLRDGIQRMRGSGACRGARSN